MKPELESRALRAAQFCREHGITQADIATAVGASQPQVSRILKGQGIRASRLFEDVCLYIEKMSGGVTVDAVRENDELIEAVQAVWDGSSAHARALAIVIRSLAAFGRAEDEAISKT